MTRRIASRWSTALALALLLSIPIEARAAEQLCDPGYQDCRATLIALIRQEAVGIDVAFWFMEDNRYKTELIARFQQGVPIRVLIDPRANVKYPLNKSILDELSAAGIPMRKRTSTGILHWKMMLFYGQNTVEFSGANYSATAFVPLDPQPYVNYIDESIYFTDDPAVVNSFKTKYDNLWTNTTSYANYANISGPLVRSHATYPIISALNFPPGQDYADRSVALYNAETLKIDTIMFRITDTRHTDAMIAAVTRGVPVRLITEPDQYRDPNKLWHSWNVDRLYMAGIQIRNRAHAGLNHQKSVLLYNQGLTIFGSSNWSTSSANSQQEHNYFTTKAWIFQWFVDQFERKWNNNTGVVETAAFVPLAPDPPTNILPADGAVGEPTTKSLTWNGGYFSHTYDVYFGTDPNPALFASGLALGPSQTTTDNKTFALPTLTQGTTYYWRIVGRTFANKTKTGPTWSFTTTGAPPPPPPGTATIVIWASDVATTGITGNWAKTADATAAGGIKLRNANAGAAKIDPALVTPKNSFDVSFQASAGVPYHLWLRMKADSNSTGNDSVHVQFSGSVDGVGSSVYRIGTENSTEVSLQNGPGATIKGWGWADNGWAVMGPNIYFATTGIQTIRVQQREDGASIDQIVLSPDTYLSISPGAGQSDTTILPSTTGG